MVLTSGVSPARIQGGQRFQDSVHLTVLHQCLCHRPGGARMDGDRMVSRWRASYSLAPMSLPSPRRSTNGCDDLTCSKYWTMFVPTYRSCGLVVECPPCSAGDRGSIPGRVRPGLLKVVPDASQLGIQHEGLDWVKFPCDERASRPGCV